MKIENIKSRACELKEKYQNINNWIKDNINTEPNFREIVECVVDYGSLVSTYVSYYDEVGYPLIEENGRKATHYDIAKLVPDVKYAQQELHEMLRLRSNHEFFKDSTATKFMNELLYKAEVGEYKNIEDMDLQRTKKDVLCMSAGTYFYIWQVSQKEPWYQYDNVEEWNMLNGKYSTYKENIGIQEVKNHVDGTSYSGPQFGEIIEEVISGISKTYKYNNLNLDKEESKSI